MGRDGVITRLVPDFYARQMYGGRCFVPATPGNLGYVELYNNSNYPKLLSVWGIVGSTVATNEIILESYQGTHQTFQGIFGPLYAGDPVGVGLLGGFATPACLGDEIGVLETNAGSQAWWPWNWPAAVIQPGYSFAFHISNPNANFSSGVWWRESKRI